MTGRPLSPEEKELANAASIELMKLVAKWEMSGLPPDGITGILLATAITSAIISGHSIDKVLDIIKKVYDEVTEQLPPALSPKVDPSLN